MAALIENDGCFLSIADTPPEGFTIDIGRHIAGAEGVALADASFFKSARLASIASARTRSSACFSACSLLFCNASRCSSLANYCNSSTDKVFRGVTEFGCMISPRKISD